MPLRILIALLLFAPALCAQIDNPAKGHLFDDNVLPRIDIEISAAALDLIYDDIWSDFEHGATFTFTHPEETYTINNVGFRLRGNTSRVSAKKSFKVSFNSFTAGGKFLGVEKLNLNGEHNDPSITRSKVCWDILRKMDVPAARCNHVELYINGEYYGLYLNVEHIDEEFMEARFGNKSGNLYKCLWPSDLNYEGDSPNDYASLGYNLTNNLSTFDLSDLVSFIDALNNSGSDLPCELEQVFNVQSYLKIMAFDVLTGNWDGYYNKNNFYLYHNERSGQLEYVSYDLDNTLGIDWFGINWSEEKIYDWLPSEDRPLLKRLLEVSEYRNRFSFYIEWILDEFMGDTLFTKLDFLKDLTTDAAFRDDFRGVDYGFDNNDFLESFETAWGDHVTMGIKEFINARKETALSQLESYSYPPLLSNVRYVVPHAGADMHFRVNVFDDEAITAVGLNYNDNDENFGTLVMEESEPGVYQLTIPFEQGDGFYNFNFNATDVDDNTGASSCAMISIPKSGKQLNLRVNEIMARNASTVIDEQGDFDDWIELYNAGTESLELGKVNLSDNPHWVEKWTLPEMTLAPGEFVLIWADGDTSDGALHANFKLSGLGESVAVYSGTDLTEPPFLLEDIVDYEEQTLDQSIGLLPDGSGVAQNLSFATPGWSNEAGVGIDTQLNELIEIGNRGNLITITNASEIALDGLFIYSSNGQYVGAKRLDSSDSFIEVPTTLDNTGIYVLVLRDSRGHFYSNRILLSR